MNQLTLFESPPNLAPRDTNVASTDVKRLGGQNAAILSRLRNGPATNAELACISLKYTGRISDLRGAGYLIDCIRGEGGLNTYRLVGVQPCSP